MKRIAPSLDRWLREAKEDPGAADCGMYLIHNGTVRRTSKAAVRQGKTDDAPVAGMLFDYDEAKAEAAAEAARKMPGIGYVRVWLNRGELAPGDDIMLVLIGGDIRPHVTAALDYLVGRLKNECVSEQERS